MDIVQFFEYDKYLITMRSSDSSTTIALEVVGPDRVSLYAAEQTLVKFNHKTFAAAFKKSSDHLNISMTYPEFDKLVLKLSFRDPLVGEFEQAITLTKQRELSPSDQLKNISAKLKQMCTKYDEIQRSSLGNLLISSSVETFGLSPEKVMGYCDGSYQDYDYQSEVQDKEICSVSLSQGTYLITYSMLMQAPGQQYTLQFESGIRLYSCLPTDPNTGYPGPPIPICAREVYTVNEKQQVCRLFARNYSNSPLSITNCVLTAELMKR